MKPATVNDSVNGRDLSQASHEEAVQAFLNAEEPISIEVLRRARSETTRSPPAEIKAAPIEDKALAMQTNSTGSCICPRCGYNPASPAENTLAAAVKKDQEGPGAVASSNARMAGEYFDVDNGFSATDQQEDLQEDDGLADEEEFKITIRKPAGQTNLDVICRNVHQEPGRPPLVLVDQIRDEQIHKDGLLLEEDRILEINGEIIRDAQHAMRLFADPTVGQLIILIRGLRPSSEDDGEDSAEELRMAFLEDYHGAGDDNIDEDGLDECLNNHEKDSGLAESCKNDDSSENDLMSPRSSKYNTTSSGGCCDMDGELGLRHVRNAGMQTDLDGSSPTRPLVQRRASLDSIQNELLGVSMQMDKAKRDIQNLMIPAPNSSPVRPPKPPRAPRTSSLPKAETRETPMEKPVIKTRIKHPKPQAKHANAARSGSVVQMDSREFFEFPAAPVHPPIQSMQKVFDWRNGPNFVSPPGTINNGGLSGDVMNRRNAGSAGTRTPVHAPLTAPKGPTRLLPQMLNTVREDEELGLVRHHIYEQINDENVTSLQRSSSARSDGRKMDRHKLKKLEERAQRIAQERSGLTTDDDARSELKTGRYWSKEDKRIQLQAARDSKRQREMEKVRLQLSVTDDKPNIIALSQRKQMKRNARNIDEFGTGQEILTNKNRSAVKQDLKPTGLPNVTTV